MAPLTDFGDLWWYGRYSEYFYSFWGRLEYVLVRYMLYTLERNPRLCNELGINYGDTNSMGLYLSHWGYSPFVDYTENDKLEVK